MSRIDRVIKDIESSYRFTKLLFDLIKNVLTIGAIYYIANKYSSDLAKSLAFMLIWTLLVPIASGIFFAIYPFKNEKFLIIWSAIGTIIISIPIQYYFIDIVDNFVKFISTK